MANKRHKPDEIVQKLRQVASWQVSDGRVERLWKREGLKVPSKQPKKGRLWLNDGSCIRLKPERRDHVWSYDFVHCRTDDGKVFRTLSMTTGMEQFIVLEDILRVDQDTRYRLQSGLVDAVLDRYLLAEK